MKKGELTTQQIVILVIVIVSFAVILFLLFRLNFGEETDKELCHNSVIMRSNSITPTETLPLKCQTSYVCITEDGSCEQMTNPKIKKVKTKDDVYQILADEMADCWWMFGEGKVDYVGNDWLSKNLYCSICSQVGFDDSLKLKEELFKEGVLDEQGFYNYLSNKKTSKDITYSEYLFGAENFQNIHSGPFKQLNLDNPYYIMMGIKSEKSAWTEFLIGAGVAGAATAAVVFSPLTGGLSLISVTGILITGGGAAAGGVAGAFIGATGEGASGNEFLKPTLLEANSEEFNALGCEEIKTLA